MQKITGRASTEQSKSKTIVIFAGARDYHAVDWYRAIKSVLADDKVIFITDMFEAEGMRSLLHKGDDVRTLFIVDRLLFRRQSRFGGIWRNVLKFALVPVQAMMLRRHLRGIPNWVIHAHPMYYMLVCWVARVPFVGTPQGSELLVRPRRSLLYRAFASRCLRAARFVTVDSEQMWQVAHEIAGIRAVLVQNGIDTRKILDNDVGLEKRTIVCSLRGVDPLYQIAEILDSRNCLEHPIPITFVYPFRDDVYYEDLLPKTIPDDLLLGSLPKDELYSLLSRCMLVISVPKSDSSPRSVYEAIFAGAMVAVSPNPYIDALPDCMRKRLIIVDLRDPQWLEVAIAVAKVRQPEGFSPTPEAVEQFDQYFSMKMHVEMLYEG